MGIKRGFIRILEAVIASLILLASLSFFFVPSVLQRTDNAIERIHIEDALSSVQKSGLLESLVKENDVGGLNIRLKTLMPQAVDFSVEINGIPNPAITIGCVCSDGDTKNLENMLSPLDFSYKQRTITISVQRMRLEELAGTQPDILFFFGKDTMYSSDEDEQNKIITNLTRFLNNGTVFLFSAMAEQDVTDLNTKYGALNGFMGLQWYPGGAQFHKGEFYDITDPKTASYRISDYFAAISGLERTIDFTFSNPADINKIAVDERTVIKSNTGGPTEISYVKINKEILENGNGRTAWFAVYDTACPAPPAQCPADDIEKLLKAAVMWASGEKYKMDSGFKTIPTSGEVSRYSYLGVLDGFEPFQIVLTVWKIFS